MKESDILLLNSNLELWNLVISAYRIPEIQNELDFTGSSIQLKYEQEDIDVEYVRNKYDDMHNIIRSIDTLSDHDKAIFKQLWRIKKNMQMRKYRYKRILKDWLNKGLQVVFLTLTFNDENLNQGFDHCRSLISSWLNDNCDDYMANDDYGDENNRLHYHAIAILSDSNNLKKTIIDKYHIQHYNLGNYNLGFSDVQMVIRGDSDNVTKYFNKIANHSIKSSANSPHNILRPRKNKKVIDI